MKRLASHDNVQCSFIEQQFDKILNSGKIMRSYLTITMYFYVTYCKLNMAKL